MFMQNMKGMDGFDRVKSILVLRDAETDARDAERSVRGSFSKCGFSVPAACCQWDHDANPSVAYTLLPSCSSVLEEGALEDLCWRILTGTESADIKARSQGFIDAVKMDYPERLSTLSHKARLHTFFSTDDKLVSMKIGEAAKAGAFDWNSRMLEPLRDIISSGWA